MRIEPATGLLDAARQVASPNHDERPPGSAPELVVVHCISLPPGEFGGGHIEALFLNRLDPLAHPYFADVAHLQVSAHVLIRRTGEVIQFVALERRAWHAGQSQFCGRERCNDFSIGIELEGEDETPYDDRQYEALQGVIRALCAAYPAISPRQVAGHSDIAPGRKTDPGPAFDWFRLYDGLGPENETS